MHEVERGRCDDPRIILKRSEVSDVVDVPPDPSALVAVATSGAEQASLSSPPILAPVTVGPGDAFVVEAGFKGVWRIEETVLKHFDIKLK